MSFSHYITTLQHSKSNTDSFLRVNARQWLFKSLICYPDQCYFQSSTVEKVTFSRKTSSTVKLVAS